MATVPKSGVKGVLWNKTSKKWCGCVFDPTERSAKGKGRARYTAVFSDLSACVAAREELVAEMQEKKATILHEMAQDLPHTRNLPLCPTQAADARPKTAYYGEARALELRPKRFVRVASGSKGFFWGSCCQHGVGSEACTQQAKRHAKGEEPIFCGKHGGVCPHGRRLDLCDVCTPNMDGDRNLKCSVCRTKQLKCYRLRTQGGSGVCAECERRVEAERAAEQAAKDGKAPTSAKKQKFVREHELKMLERLVCAGYIESFAKGIAPQPGEFLREVYVDHRCALGSEFAHDEKRYAHVDFVVHPKQGGKLIFLEMDEGEHKFPGYSALCDSTRMWNVAASLKLNFSGDINVLWLRVNPNTRFSIGDVVHKPSNTERCDAVCALLDSIAGKDTDPPMQMTYAFYQMHADCRAKVLDDPDYHPLVKAGALTLTHVIGPNRVTLSL